MDNITYREAVFDVVRTLSYERTRVKDAQNSYLYTHHDILVEVHWHPFLTSFTIPAPGGIPVFTPNTDPGTTDLALLSRLLQPRGLLIIEAAGTTILQAPQKAVNGPGNYSCDVTGGPSVEAVGVPLMIGVKHWFVTLHIQADVRDQVFRDINDDQNAVLSNLWVGTEDIDFQRRSVRRFAGRAILRADIMRENNLNASSLRDLYLFPCPNHYQRQNVQVQLSEDGAVLDWSFEDVMRGYDVGIGSEILDIECYRTGSTQRNSPLQFFLDGVRHSINIGKHTVGMGGLAGAAGVGLAALGVGAAAVGGIVLASIENLPKSFVHCRCDLTGDRNANLGRLTAIALGVCINQTSTGGLLRLVTGTFEITFRQDIADKVYTSVEISSFYTADVFKNMEVPSVSDIANWQQRLNDATSSLNTASAALCFELSQDHRKLVMRQTLAQALPAPQIVPPPPNTEEIIIASRQGDFLGTARSPVGLNNNPPMLQGAYGSVPNETPGSNPAPLNNLSAFPLGTTPTGIEHLIVQTLLGQNQIPPEPRTLNVDS